MKPSVPPTTQKVEEVLKGTFRIPPNLLVWELGGGLRLIDVKTGEILSSLKLSEYIEKFTPVGTDHVLLTTAGEWREGRTSILNLWNLRSNSVEVLPGIHDEVVHIRNLDPFVLFGHRRLVLWDPFENKQVASHEFPYSVLEVSEALEPGINAVMLANNTVVIHDWNSGRSLRDITLTPSIPSSTRITGFSRRGDDLAVVYVGTTYLVNWKTGKQISYWPFDNAFLLGEPGYKGLLGIHKNMVFLLEEDGKGKYVTTDSKSLGKNPRGWAQISPFEVAVQVGDYYDSARIQLIQVDTRLKKVRVKVLVKIQGYRLRSTPWNPHTFRILRCVLRRRLERKLPRDLIREVMGFF